MAYSKSRTHHRKRNIIIAIIVVLVLARIALPYVVLHYANKSLANLKTMYGHIDDIDIALYRGAYKINDIFLNKKDSVSGQQTKFFKTQVIDLSVEWRSLFKGRLVGELELYKPELIFTADKAEPKDVQKDSTDLKKILDDFMPLDINRFEINEGVLRYTDNGSKPKVDIEMDDIYVHAQNLSSVVDSSLLPSPVFASAAVYGGRFEMNMKVNALADEPTFDLNLDLKNTDLPRLNEFFQAYGKFDVNKGKFDLYSEVAANKGKFTGYVKPVIKDLDVLGKEDRKDTFFHKVYEGLVGAVGVVLRNPKEKQVATKLRLDGTFKKDTNTDTWYAIIEVLRNAFIRALQPSIDEEINIASVDKQAEKEEKKGFLKKVFGKKDDKKK